MKSISLMCMAVVLLLTSGIGATVSPFDDLTLTPESYWNGSDGSGGFVSGNAFFSNSYSGGFWSSFAYSNRTDIGTVGFDAQYTSITGGGVAGSSNYAISYYDSWAAAPRIQLGASVISGGYFSNNAYGYHSMADGDAFAKKFGGAGGNDPDWFLLTIYGLDANLQHTGDSVDFYLADFRFGDNAQDYIVSNWSWVDLSSLGVVSGLEFEMTSSDVGQWGMNTPAYFALDNLTFNPVPEPAMMLLFIVGALIRKRNR